jgi:uncharacterized protein
VNSIRAKHAVAICLWIGCAAAVSAQNDIRGHWSGTIDTPAGALVMEVDLDKAASGWIGSVSIPAQNATGIPLGSITFADGKAAFIFQGGPGNPGYSGTLSEDGKTLDGAFSQGPQSLPLKLTRTGSAKVEPPKASSAVAAEFVGTWEGTINFGIPLRLVLTISNGKEGAEAVMISLDQGNARIPVSAVIQKDTKLALEVKAVGGNYEGEMNKEGTEINGSWTQAGNGTPLVLKKSSTTAK